MKSAYWCIPFLKRKIYSIDKFKRDFSIDVSTSNPIVINMNRECPEVVISLNACNKSDYLDIEFDRAVISFGYGYQIITDFPIVRSRVIRRKDDSYMRLNIPLNAFQRAKIIRWVKLNKLEADASITIDYYIKSNLHNYWEIKYLDHRPCKLNGLPEHIKECIK